MGQIGWHIVWYYGQRYGFGSVQHSWAIFQYSTDNDTWDYRDRMV